VRGVVQSRIKYFNPVSHGEEEQFHTRDPVQYSLGRGFPDNFFRGDASPVSQDPYNGFGHDRGGVRYDT
jgi:hypothetical protein